MPKLESVEIRNILEGKTRARSSLVGSRQHYHGSSCLTHRMVRTWLSGVILQHVQWNTALAYRWQRRAGRRDYTPILPFIIVQRESIFKGKLAKGLELHFIFISYTIFSFIPCIRLLFFFFNHLIGAHPEMIWLKSGVKGKTYNSLFGCKRLCSLVLNSNHHLMLFLTMAKFSKEFSLSMWCHFTTDEAVHYLAEFNTW